MIFTFDCYGTLIDWLNGAKKAFRDIYPHVDEDTVNKFIDYWGKKDWEMVVSGVYRPYREILAEGFKYALEKLELKYDETTIRELTFSIYEWKPFPDVKDVLLELKKRNVKLGIISNTDKDFIMKSIENIGVNFDYIIVAEDLKMYKPDPHVFIKARELLPKDTWIHVSSYPQYDIIPASKAGVNTILLDRYNLGSMLEDYETKVINDIRDLLLYTE